tara:strand:- start:820 stop:1065 length:246 start_codon:yes stop_codon:yes gene_type:complete
MFNLDMSEKGFESDITFDETPNFRVTEEKPLKQINNKSKKVDINILKARAKNIQDRENRKNIFIFVFTLFILGIVGIYLSI